VHLPLAGRAYLQHGVQGWIVNNGFDEGDQLYKVVERSERRDECNRYHVEYNCEKHNNVDYRLPNHTLI